MKTTINDLSTETGLDRRTIKKLLSDTKPTAGENGAEFFDLRDLVAALRGAKDSTNALRTEKIRETRHRANLLELEERKARGEVLDTETVIQVWSGYLHHCRQVIRHSELSEQRKREILDQLKAVPLAEFTSQKPMEEE